MKALRQILGFPLSLLQLLIALSGEGGARFGRMCMRAYYPVCRARRWVVGEPPWKPIDYFSFGSPPRTDAERTELERYFKESITISEPIDLGIHTPQLSISGEIATAGSRRLDVAVDDAEHEP